MAVVYQRLQSVALLPQQADQLTHMLHLTGSYTDLKEIVHRSITARVEFFQLVSALLLTPHLGRYVSLLVPYCKYLLLAKYTMMSMVLSYLTRLLQSSLCV